MGFRYIWSTAVNNAICADDTQLGMALTSCVGKVSVCMCATCACIYNNDAARSESQDIDHLHRQAQSIAALTS